MANPPLDQSTANAPDNRCERRPPATGAHGHKLLLADDPELHEHAPGFVQDGNSTWDSLRFLPCFNLDGSTPWLLLALILLALPFSFCRFLESLNERGRADDHVAVPDVV